MKRWSFAKYVGCGNDFIIFDNRPATFPAHPSLIQRLCQRQNGIGADGLLLLENSTKAQCRLRIFNSDGSEAEMCGNGVRCFVKWLAHLGFENTFHHIEIMQNIVKAKQIDQDICIEMGNPRHLQWNILLRFEGQFLRLHHLNTGVPHTVLFVKDIENVNVTKLGTYIRNYSLWKPKGTNVTLAQQIQPQRLAIRTYERGVEGETLACGTGATAAALVAARQCGFSSPVTVKTRSGEELTIGFSFDNQTFSDVTLTGPAKCAFIGEVDLPEMNEYFHCL